MIAAFTLHMDSKIESPLEMPKKEEILDGAAGFKTDKEVGGAGVAKDCVNEVDKEVGIKSPIKPFSTPGFCRRCHETLDIPNDGRGGLWIVPNGNGKVFVDGNGLCSDCEQSNETDPNWGRSRRLSDEDTSSSSEEVSSSTKRRKKQ